MVDREADDFVEDATSGRGELWLLCLPPALPVLSTLLLFLIGERRWLWICHLAAWGVMALFSLLFFFGGNMYTWGDGLASVVAITTLVVEILSIRKQRPH